MPLESMNNFIKFRIDYSKNKINEKDFLDIWRRLILNGESQKKIFQTPEFFNFLDNTNKRCEQLEVFSVTEVEREEIIGVVPVSFKTQQVSFQVGRKNYLSRNINIIELLGSIPLMPTEPALIEHLFNYLFQQFNECHAISMSALPSDSNLWHATKKYVIVRGGFCICIINDWRECHTIPLPTNFELYLKQFSTKKRYNLKRQMKLLQENSGELYLHRVQKSSDVMQLVSAIDKLASNEEKNNYLSEVELKELAECNLLLCYVLNCADVPSALIFGIYSNNVLHVFDILYSKNLARFSMGTIILHLAIEDMISSLKVSSIDLGYGSPGHSYQSTNITKERGQVLVFRNTFKNNI